MNTYNRFNVLRDIEEYPSPVGIAAKRKLMSEGGTNFKKYFIVRRCEEGKSFYGVSPFLIQKGLEGISSAGIEEVQKLRSGELLVLINSYDASKVMSKAKNLGPIPIQTELHKQLNFCKGTIYCHDLKDLSEDEILDELKAQKVVKVEKIKRKENEKLINTAMHILTFDATEMPKSIKAGYINLHVRLYVPNPLRCHNCQAYGHTKKYCRKGPVCHKCADPIVVPHETPCTQEKCANCGEAHGSFSKDCPVWMKERAILKIKVEERLTYIKARQLFDQRHGNGPMAPKLTRPYNKLFDNDRRRNTKNSRIITKQTIMEKDNINIENNIKTTEIETTTIQINAITTPKTTTTTAAVAATTSTAAITTTKVATKPTTIETNIETEKINQQNEMKQQGKSSNKSNNSQNGSFSKIHLNDNELAILNDHHMEY